MNDTQTAIDAIRRWQRHWLLRQYGEDGQVLSENLALSAHIDTALAVPQRGWIIATANERVGSRSMGDITPITNLVGDLDTYADELGGEGWHNAANACRHAVAEIERLRIENGALLRRCNNLESDLAAASRGLNIHKRSEK